MVTKKKAKSEDVTLADGRRRGGRKPGEWKFVTADEIKAFREEHRVSRARLASALGVSSTSVQNWETGTVATLKTQQQLAEIMKAGPAALATVTPSGAGGWDPGAIVGPQITTTGTIVTGFLTSQQGKMSTDQLIELSKNVRQALT